MSVLEFMVFEDSGMGGFGEVGVVVVRRETEEENEKGRGV
jgi:hypothetical protein